MHDSAPSSFPSLSQRGSSGSGLTLLCRLSVGRGPASLWLGDGDLADSAHGERSSVMYLASCISKWQAYSNKLEGKGRKACTSKIVQSSSSSSSDQSCKGLRD